MDQLTALVKLLDKGSMKSFEQFLKKKNKREDVKNIDLLKIIKTDDIDALEKLYSNSKKHKDAYHAARKRLTDSLLQFLSQQAIGNDSSEIFQAQQCLIISRFLLENELNTLAQKQLRKAEFFAEKAEQFGLLNEILLLQLQFAHRYSSISLQTLSEKLAINQHRLQQEARLHLAFAHLRQQIQRIQLKNYVINLTELITETMLQYNIDTKDFMTYKSLYQVLCIANEYAAIYHDYSLIETYIDQSQAFLEVQEDVSGNQLFYHLHLLYYLANYYFRSRKFEESLKYLSKMQDILGNNKSQNQQFFLRHQMLMALNIYFSGRAAAAIEIAQTALNKSDKNSTEEDVNDLNACLVLFYSQQHNDACLTYLSALTRTDAWYEKRLGMLWSIRKNIMEIVVHVQFQNIELALSRLDSFKRRYKSFLKTTGEQRVLDFIRLLELMLKTPDTLQKKSYREAVLALLDVAENQDIFSLSFIAWLAAQWQSKSPYEVTLELLSNA